MVRIKATFKSGKTLDFNMDNYTNFREASNHLLKASWNIFDKFAFQTNELMYLEEIERPNK
ncbi:hypothetical protein [Paenibacillus chitinolyticus]|uniref:hypothetical protein n=1 Tax=Paenibacillus chitinolyticus TaxID=79263 RepID=UPI003672063F